MPALFRPYYKDKKTGERKRVRRYWAKVRFADDTVRKVKLSTDKKASGQMLAEIVRRIELERSGLADPFAAPARRLLGAHLDDWAADLLAGGATAKHAAHTVGAARRVFNGCEFTAFADLSESAVRRFIADLRSPRPVPVPDPDKVSYTKAELAVLLGIKPCGIPPLVKRHSLAATGNGKARRYPGETAAALAGLRGAGMSVKSANMHLAATKQFGAWMVRDRRAGVNPLAGLRGTDPEADRRRVVATLTVDQLRSLVAAARVSPAGFRGLSGPDRAALYTLAVYTALRPVELSRLTPADFRLDGPVPFVRLDGSRTKNGRAAEQAVPAGVAAEFRAYLAGRPAGEPVWPGTWHEKAADLIRVDLPAAGVPLSKPGPDGEVMPVGFYSLRHSAGPLAEAGGATLREVMTLMRHSNANLTLRTYGRLRLEDRGVTVAKMPPLTPSGAGDLAQDLARLGPKLGQAADDGRGRLRTGEESCVRVEGAEVLENKRIEDVEGSVRTGKESSPGRIRTYDPPVNSRLLYR